MRKTQIFIKKTVYLGLSILKLSKIVIYEFWYDYVKPKSGEKTKLCEIDADINRDDICKDIAKDIETRFETMKKTYCYRRRKMKKCLD